MTKGRRDPGAPIVVSTYDLCAALYEPVNRFPRAQRTLLGRLILDEALRMLAALTVARFWSVSVTALKRPASLPADPRPTRRSAASGGP